MGVSEWEIEGARGDCNSIERITISIDLDPSELPESRSKTKEHTWADLWPWAYVTVLSGLSERGCP